MASSSKMIILVSSDGEKFEVEEEVAKKSQMLNDLFEDVSDNHVITLPNVTGKILSKVLEYCKKHYDAGENNEKIPEKELKAWDDDFVSKIDQNTLYLLMMAANYMNITNLLDLTCQTVANMIKGKTPEEIRDTLNIKSDFTPEEEEEIRKERSWANWEF